MHTLKLSGTYAPTPDTTAAQLADDGDLLQHLGSRIISFIANDYTTRPDGDIHNNHADGDTLYAALKLLEMGQNCSNQAIQKLKQA